MFSAARVNAIFGNMEELYAFQTNFLKDLESCINWDALHLTCVGEAFINNVSRVTHLRHCIILFKSCEKKVNVHLQNSNDELFHSRVKNLKYIQSIATIIRLQYRNCRSYTCKKNMYISSRLVACCKK